MLSLKSSTSPHSAARNALGEKLCFKFINDSSSCYRNATAARQCLETRAPFMFPVRGAGCWGYLTMQELVHPIPSFQGPTNTGLATQQCNRWVYLQCTDWGNAAPRFLQIPGGHCRISSSKKASKGFCWGSRTGYSSNRLQLHQLLQNLQHVLYSFLISVGQQSGQWDI